MYKNKPQTLSHTIDETNLKHVIELKVKSKTTKFLKRKHGRKSLGQAKSPEIGRYKAPIKK